MILMILHCYYSFLLLAGVYPFILCSFSSLSSLILLLPPNLSLMSLPPSILPPSLSLSQVAVYDYIWTADDRLVGSTNPDADPPRPAGETCTHVAVYTLYLSGVKQRYRHFLRQPGGTIMEVRFSRTCHLNT